MTDKQIRPPYEIALMHDHILRLEEELKAKEQECEELKFPNKRLDEVTLYWHKRIFKLERSERKLKQTLTEIKEIAEWKNEYWSLGIDDYKNMADEILQKISEVEE